MLLAAAIGLLSPLAGVAGPPTTRPRVFVFARAGTDGFVDQDSKKRSEILAELKEKLAHKASLDVVADESAADLTIEILGQEHYRSETTVRLVAGDYKLDIVKKSRGLVGGGGIGATGWVVGQIANAIEDWVKDNRERLSALRIASPTPVPAPN